MTARNVFDLPPDLSGEHLLLWAVAHQARLDASYQPRSDAKRCKVSEQERREAQEFLQQLRSDLRACA